MSSIPFILSLDSPNYYNHDMFPNTMYRRLHARHHDPLDFHTLGLIARLGAHAHQLGAKRDGRMPMLANTNKNGDFEVNLDVGLFKPSELTVKVVNDHVVIEGKHEEREDDHGHISRHFVRRYELPKGYDANAIVSKLSSDGVISVHVPKPIQQNENNERIIQIQQTGPSDLFLKTTNSTKNDNSQPN